MLALDLDSNFARKMNRPIYSILKKFELQPLKIITYYNGIWIERSIKTSNFCCHWFIYMGLILISFANFAIELPGMWLDRWIKNLITWNHIHVIAQRQFGFLVNYAWFILQYSFIFYEYRLSRNPKEYVICLDDFV